MWVKCQILLSSRPLGGQYHNGATVSGVLVYELKKRTEFTSATLRLKGKGKCSWTESDSDDNTSSYSAKEDYVHLEQNILQETGYDICAGVHKHEFKFVLPSGLPSSFKDKTGKITYKITAIFSKSGFIGSTKKFKTDIPFSGDLIPCSPEPLIFGLTKTPFTLLSKSGLIDVKVRIMKTFLVRGEYINLEYITVNDTSVPVVGYKIKLFSERTYTSKSKHKLVKRKKVDGSSVECGPNKNSDETLSCKVPTPRSPEVYTVQHSNIIRREYKLQVTTVLPFPHRNASVEVPVVIA